MRRSAYEGDIAFQHESRLDFVNNQWLPSRKLKGHNSFTVSRNRTGCLSFERGERSDSSKIALSGIRVFILVTNVNGFALNNKHSHRKTNRPTRSFEIPIKFQQVHLL